MTEPAPIGSAENIVHGTRQARAPFPAWIRQVLQLTVVALLALLSYFIISQFLLQTVSVVGVSMSPTLQDSQRYLLNRWIYHFRDPQRAEVVVLRDPLDHGFSVKRVVAGPGATVYLKKGTLYVDGAVLEEPYLPKHTPTFTAEAASEQLFRCGRDQYFVLGDNRQNSVDSRVYGPVSRQDILGLVVR